MKYNFQDLNIEPMPNPKPIKVQRVSISVQSAEGKTSSSGDGFIVNTCIHPASLIYRRG